MGCNGNGDNYMPDLTQYVNLNIGETFDHAGYCGKADKDTGNEGPVNCGTNGEFGYGGNQDVSCKCEGACGNALCRRKKCKRNRFSGDPYQCCSRGGIDYYNDGQIRTCDFSYRRNNFASGKCDLSFETYCAEGENLFGTTCRNWITAVTDGQKKGNGSVDTVLFTVCNRPENATKPECGCIVAANKLKQDFPTSNDIPVQCMYNDCANNPLAFRASTQIGDCNIVHCEMTIDDLEIIAGNPEEFDVDFVQQCSNTQEEPSTPSPDNGGGGGSAPPPSRTAWFWIILVIILLAIGFAVYYFFFRKPKVAVTRYNTATYGYGQF